ncbi:hypothetical protein [Corallococcus exercitus]|uniref:Uncharacterized protein n=1 Tax=Corallococcus exercitus TaxID=2316736 RepID=A0A7Y4KFM3_9BACT|nr:hypothetical protein [Corallococcus exercitus]NOK32791.1 hypothetical protein [Corallococcus exercitus]
MDAVVDAADLPASTAIEEAEDGGIDRFGLFQAPGQGVASLPLTAPCVREVVGLVDVPS